MTSVHIISILYENDNSKDIDYNSLVQIFSRFKNKVLKKYDTNAFFIQNTYGAGYSVQLDRI